MLDGLQKPGMLMDLATKAGYPDDVAEELIKKPKEHVESIMGPRIASALTPETITVLFRSLEGENARGSQGLVELANVLYQFETYLDKQENKNLAPEEIRLLSFVSKLLEESLYRGGLSKLSDKNAAALAFLINRLAKIKDISGSGAKVKGFDVPRFELFTDEIQKFADHYLSEETIDQMVVDNDKEITKAEDQLGKIANPKIQDCIKNIHETQKDEERFDELINGDIKLAIQDIVIRLRKIVRMYETFFSQPLAVAVRERINYLIICLGSLTNEKITEIIFAKQQGKPDSKILGTALSLVQTNEKKLGIKQNNYTEDELISAVRSCVRSLRKKNSKFNKETDSGKINKIDYSLLKVAEELSTLDHSGVGIWEELEHLILNLDTAQKDVDPTFLAKEPAVAKYFSLLKKRKMLLTERTFLPLYRDQFKRSKDVVLRDIRQHSATDLYFLKTVLVGSDIVARERFWGHLGLHQAFSDKAFKSHKMLDYKDYHLALPRNDSEKTSNANKYSDIHYKASQLPFAIVAARYFQEKKKQPSIKTQVMPSVKTIVE